MTLVIPLGTLLAFLLVLARVSALLAFLPLAGFRNAPPQIRIILALVLSFALFPAWPHPENQELSMGALLASIFAEAGFGLSIGISVSLLNEAFQLAMQVLGLQAGYGYASTIDPTSQADSGILQVLAALMSGLLFLSLGLDRQLLRILAASFNRFPAGEWAPAAASLDGIVRLGSGMFSLGLRLAFPVVAFLMLIDLALALLGRMQQQLQLLTLAFPVKMLAAVACLIVLLPAFTRLYEDFAAKMVESLWLTVSR